MRRCKWKKGKCRKEKGLEEMGWWGGGGTEGADMAEAPHRSRVKTKLDWHSFYSSQQ